MGFAQFLSVLFARRKAALIALLLVVGTTLVVSLLLPSQYTASASVVVDAKPDPVSAVMYPGMTSPAYMATQVDIIQSERVANRVVRNLRLLENPQVREQWRDDTQGQGSMETWLSQLLRKKMDVKPSRDSSVIVISYEAPDPQFATGLANAFVQAYLETSLELRVDPARQYTSFFDTRVKEAREGLEKSQAKLSAFQKENGIIATDERLDIENARLNELSSQAVLLQALASESSSRQAQAKQSADRMTEVLNNPVIAGLKVELSRAESALQQSSARLGDSHPQIAEAKANIATLRSKLEAETARVSGGVGVNDTINRQREANVKASLEEQRAKVLRLKAVRDEGAVLARDVESAQRSLELVTQRYTQTNLERQTTQSNINLLTSATPPLKPSSPRILLNVVLSLFLGLLLAVGIALGLEFMDRRVRTVVDLTAGLALPVIGILPRPGSKRRKPRGFPALQNQSVDGRLAAPAKGQ